VLDRVTPKSIHPAFLSHSRYIRNKLGNRSQVTGAEGSDRYAPFTFCSQANIFKEILEDTQRVMVLPPPSDALSRLLLSKTLIEGLGRQGLEVTLWGSKLVNGSPTTR
jgi:hypothetical protein